MFLSDSHRFDRQWSGYCLDGWLSGSRLLLMGLCLLNILDLQKKLPAQTHSIAKNAPSANRPLPVSTTQKTIPRFTPVTHDPALGPWTSPTSGKPLQLDYFPAGVHLLLSVRIAGLLQHETGQEILTAFNYFSPLLNDLHQHTFVKSKIISQALFGWIPTPSGKLPERITVLRLNRIVKPSELFDKTEHKRTIHGDYYRKPDTNMAYFVPNPTTLVIAPEKYITEILEFPTGPPIAHRLKSLLPRTDQQRHLTLVFDSEFLDDELSSVLAMPVSLFVKKVFTFFDQDFPGGLLSFHFTPLFFLEMVLSRPVNQSSRSFTGTLDKKLQRFPYQLYESLRSTNPRLGRPLVSRLPAMSKALMVCSSLHIENHQMVFRSQLPRQAGPNFAWSIPLALRAFFPVSSLVP